MSKFNDMVPVVLMKLHIGPHYKGYKYLRETIILLNDGICSSMYEAYNMLAVKYNTTLNAIGLAVRRVVKSGILESSVDTKIEVFGYDIEVENRSGRNYYMAKEFIPYMINYINTICNE